MKKTATLLTLFLIAATGAFAGTVVPNADASTPGNTDNRFPFLVSGGMRYQEVFSSSQFSGPMSIGEIDFRNGVFVDTAFSTTIADIQISLSTISVGPDGLSSTFASNVGADNTVVYNGSLTLSSTNAAGPGGTHAFDIIINLQTPFAYNPGAGNLLLDIKNISGANSNIGTDFFDAVNSSGDPVSRVFGAEGSPNATSGTADSLGLIAQFDPASTSVPEPGSIFSSALGLIGALVWRKKRSISNQ
jgi:hypothetical protein